MIDSSFDFPITSTFAPTMTGYTTGDTERRANLEYHIGTGHFFLLLATHLGFLEETAADPDSVSPELRDMQVQLARSLRTELQHLTLHYQVVPINA